MATHTFGAPCDPTTVVPRAGVPVVFDAAHAFGSSHGGRAVGGFGAAEVFSLTPTKPLVAGEGGLVATGDTALAERVREGRDYGNPGDYDTRFAGLNGRMTELHAAVGLESLASFDEHLARRRALADRYRTQLAGVPGVRLQRVAGDDRSTYKDLTVAVSAAEFGAGRDVLVDVLRAEGVDTRTYFSPPVHRQTAYGGRGTPPAGLPRTDRLASEVVSLPLWPDLPVAAVDRVASLVADVHVHAADLRRTAAGKIRVPWTEQPLRALALRAGPARGGRARPGALDRHFPGRHPPADEEGRGPVGAEGPRRSGGRALRDERHLVRR